MNFQSCLPIIVVVIALGFGLATWPWLNKKDDTPMVDWRSAALKQMMSWRAIGESFEYLGAQCFVTGYWADGCIGSIVQLQAVYADSVAVIHRISLTWPEVSVLMKKQP